MLDVARASQRDGIDAWFDIGRWLQGKLEIAPQAAPCYGDLAARILAAQRGLSKKCLVLDLDNTLWGGVIGDDGRRRHRARRGQRGRRSPSRPAALRQAAQGARSHPGRLLQERRRDRAKPPFATIRKWCLRRADFAVFEANWDDKARNLRRHRGQAQHRPRRSRVRRRQSDRAGPGAPEPADGRRAGNAGRPGALCALPGGCRLFRSRRLYRRRSEPGRTIRRQRRTRGDARIGRKHGRIPPRASK